MKILKEINFSHEYWTILLPVLLIGLDVITGVINAWIKKDLKSSVMRQGLGHKVSEFVYLAVGLLCDMAFNLRSIYYFISLYIIYMEVLSIIENCKKLGTKAPAKIDTELKELSKNFKSKE